MAAACESGLTKPKRVSARTVARRTDISAFQLFYYGFSLVVFAVAWFKGGHAERLSVGVMILAYVVSLTPPVMIGRLQADHAVQDTLLMLFFGWLALSRDRWWLFAMTACIALVVLVHVSMVVVPDLDRRADIAARLGLGVLTMAALLAGVVERWLAGEPPASAGAQWRRRVTVP